MEPCVSADLAGPSQNSLPFSLPWKPRSAGDANCAEKGTRIAIQMATGCASVCVGNYLIEIVTVLLIMRSIIEQSTYNISCDVFLLEYNSFQTLMHDLPQIVHVATARLVNLAENCTIACAPRNKYMKAIGGFTWLLDCSIL